MINDCLITSINYTLDTCEVAIEHFKIDAHSMNLLKQLYGEFEDYILNKFLPIGIGEITPMGNHVYPTLACGEVGLNFQLYYELKALREASGVEVTDDYNNEPMTEAEYILLKRDPQFLVEVFTYNGHHLMVDSLHNPSSFKRWLGRLINEHKTITCNY